VDSRDHNKLRRWGIPLVYAGTLLAVLAALAVRWALHPLLSESSPFLTFILAVLLSSWAGGWKPGLLATGLSTLAADYFFLVPLNEFGMTSANQGVQLGLFLGTALLITGLNDRLRTSLKRLRSGTEALRQSEERFRLLTESLESRVQERTAQLEEANQALEAFAYTVSHDLRAPLRGVQGFAEALLEDYAGRLDPTGQDYARRIVAAAARMEGLIQDLLAYSRLSRAQVVPQRVDLAATLTEAARQIDGLSSPGAHLRIEAPLPAVYAHRPTLVQVLVNLLSNAVKFVPPGVEPAVRVRGESRDGRVRLWVEDNGIGIAPEHQERIFNVFERLHGGEAYPGTGIGLAIVRKGVERMGGRAGVDSEPDHGARFWIELPGARDT
jgi:signal transduction histidine kinase